MQGNRNISYDITKGIGILLVVWAHTKVNHVIFSFHMPLFFIISGMFFKMDPLKDFLYKKFRTLFVPLVFFYIVSLCLKVPFQYFTKSKEDTVERVFNGELLQLTTVDVTLWFLCCLMMAYLMMYLIHYICRSDVWRMLLSIIIFSIGYLMGFSAKKIDLPLYTTHAMVCVLFMELGHCWYKIEQRVNINFYIMSILATSIFFVSLTLWNANTNIMQLELGTNVFAFLLQAISGSFVIIGISNVLAGYKNFLCKVLAIIGSYSLFVMAISEDVRFPFIYEKVHLFPYSDVIAGTIMIVAISMMCGYFLKKYFPYLWSYK